MENLETGRSGLSITAWLICIIAAIGFAFDIYELLMLPLVVRPALMELGGIAPGTEEFASWVGRLFYIPAFAGGLFGLIGGYLTDRLGRRRVLTWSILLYAFSAFFSGFSTSVEMLLVLRCTTFIGVCVEFVAAVAWLAELFQEPKQRERVLGYTQAFSSVGGLLIATANGVAVSLATRLPGINPPEWIENLIGTVHDPHAPWRYTLMSGLIPAIPLIIIRPFLPESPIWARKKSAGTLKRPSFRELFVPEFRRTTIVTTLMFACSYGAAFGAIQQIPQIVPALPEVKDRVAESTAADREKIGQLQEQLAAEKQDPTTADTKKTEGALAGARRASAQKQKLTEQQVASDVTKVQEIGGLVGRFLLAMLAVHIVSRRALLRVFQIPGLIVLPIVFAYCATTNLNYLYVGIFFAGLFTVAQFSFWGNYLPRVYPVHLRGTGESFAANIGGRMIGTSFAWLAAEMAAWQYMPGADHPTKMAYTAAIIAFGVYFVGIAASFFLPEPGLEGGHE